MSFFDWFILAVIGVCIFLCCGCITPEQADVICPDHHCLVVKALTIQDGQTRDDWGGGQLSSNPLQLNPIPPMRPIPPIPPMR